MSDIEFIIFTVAFALLVAFIVYKAYQVSPEPEPEPEPSVPGPFAIALGRFLRYSLFWGLVVAFFVFLPPMDVLTGLIWAPAIWIGWMVIITGLWD